LKQYEESEPPYRLPDNMDIFTWSVPFLAEKVTNMLYNIIKKGSDINDDDTADFDAMLMNGDQKHKKKVVLKGKINSVARINRMYTTLREESEMLLKIKNICPDGKLPRGILLEGKPAIKNGMILTLFLIFYIVLKQFSLAKDLDKVNEKRPRKK
jgi:serine/threonine-protein phosphatase 2B catalytic subunit